MEDFKGTKGKLEAWLCDSYYRIATEDNKDALNIEAIGDIDEVEANAKLFAAAPELLELHLKFLEMFSEYDMRPEDELHEYASTVRDLINKALGKEIKL